MKIIQKSKQFTQVMGTVILSALLLSSCAREIGNDIYTENAINTTYSTKLATVIDRRAVTIRENDKLKKNETGATVGAVSGAVVGGQASKGNGSLATGIAGAAIGSIVGSLAEKKLNTQKGFEYIIEVEKGNGENPELKTIIQGGEPIEIGQAVYLIEPDLVSAGRSRIRPRSA